MYFGCFREGFMNFVKVDFFILRNFNKIFGIKVGFIWERMRVGLR